jgi:hypothetical protein
MIWRLERNTYKTDMKTITLSLLVLSGGMLTSQAALTLLPDPVSSSASSSFSGDIPNWGPQRLYDANPTEADLGTGFSAGATQQYAGNGVGPHVLVFDYGETITFTGIAYSQRLGGDPVADKVQNIEVWATDTDPGPASLALPGALGAAQGNTGQIDTTAGETNFLNYPVGELSGRYVVFRLNDSGPGSFNPGGSEMQLTFVPEPATGMMGLFGLLLALRRRR